MTGGGGTRGEGRGDLNSLKGEKSFLSNKQKNVENLVKKVYQKPFEKKSSFINTNYLPSKVKSQTVHYKKLLNN